jgi:hypothetical protein
MHKKDALTATPTVSSFMGKPPCINNGFNAWSATVPLSGRSNVTALTAVNTGSDSGLSRAIQSGACVSSPSIVFFP